MEAQHRFRDEWFTRLITDIPQATSELITKWRNEKRPYLAQLLVDQKLLTLEEAMGLVKKAFRIDPFDPEYSVPEETTSKLVPDALCIRYDLFPMRPGDRSIEVAMANPVDVEALKQVSWSSGREAIPLYCIPSQLQGLRGDSKNSDAVVFDLAQQFGGSPDVEVLSDHEEERAAEAEVKAPVIRLVNAIITDAVERGASDIHIEHEEKSSQVRFRIDGQLRNILQIPSFLGVGPVVARIKIMANLDVTERFHPQDGRAKLRVSQEEIGLRVSTLPTRIGEKVVIRILDERASQVPFEDLGFRAPIRTKLEALLERDQGIILVTGPTGSGKTTTLYSGLNRVRSEDINIITIEDPIEYRLSGISQVQVNEKRGLTFASVLRSVLRQDPDIVMVGEIRDKETAEIACQAALTGHLVFSTLHTNDTISTVARLADMGVEGFKIAAGVLGITAQRLVRRLCGKCSRPATGIEVDPRIEAGLGRYFQHPRTFVAEGCEACGFTGYKGRMGMVELLEITPRLRDAISHEDSAEDLRRLALSTGSLMTMEEDIFFHLQEGHTSAEEVLPYLDFSRVEEAVPVEDPIRATPPPPDPPREHAAAASDAEEEDTLEGVRILLAENDDAVRGPLADILLESGMQVTEMRNGSEALRFAAKNPLDLLVVGSNLPGVDPVSLIQAIRSVLSLLDLPVLAVIPAGDGDRTEGVLEAGATDVIPTPLVPKVIQARVQAALGRRNLWLTTQEVMQPKIPIHEADRVAAVRATGLLDTPSEERFDRIARKAQEHFGVPVSYVAVVDEERQWFKSKVGLEADETPRDVAFCAHAINEKEALVVPDSSLDPRFSENPLATGPENVRFYAGVPLRSPEGQAIGTMCIVDHEPREMSPGDLEVLKGMAKEVEGEIWAEASG